VKPGETAADEGRLGGQPRLLGESIVLCLRSGTASGFNCPFSFPTLFEDMGDAARSATDKKGALGLRPPAALGPILERSDWSYAAEECWWESIPSFVSLWSLKR